MSPVNPYAPPTADVADVPVREPAPALWNPNAAASWSIIFSPIFGSYLHMKNWQAMGETEKAATSRVWFWISIGFLVLVGVASGFLPESKGLDALARFAGFGLLIAWYYAIGKSQNALVLARYGKDYPRKGWLKPLAIAVAVFVGFIVAAVLVGVLAAIVTGN